MQPIVINGTVVLVTFDPNGNVTTIIIPAIVDPNTGQPQTISFMPAVPIAFVMFLVEYLMDKAP